MRKILMTAALAALLAVPALAQFPGFGRMGGPEMLLGNKSVQTELKMTDKQKDALKAAQEKMQADFKKAREDMDFEGFRTAMENYGKALKKIKDGLSKDQAKRLNQIEVQNAGLDAFDRDDVKKALKLTEKQQDAIKDAKKDLQSDVKELLTDARGDREKLTAAFKKVGELRTKATDKVLKSLTADQKKEWDKLTGKKFEMKMEGFPGFGGGRPKDDK